MNNSNYFFLKKFAHYLILGISGLVLIYGLSLIDGKDFFQNGPSLISATHNWPAYVQSRNLDYYPTYNATNPQYWQQVYSSNQATVPTTSVNYYYATSTSDMGYNYGNWAHPRVDTGFNYPNWAHPAADMGYNYASWNYPSADMGYNYNAWPR